MFGLRWSRIMALGLRTFDGSVTGGDLYQMKTLREFHESIRPQTKGTALADRKNAELRESAQ